VGYRTPLHDSFVGATVWLVCVRSNATGDLVPVTDKLTEAIDNLEGRDYLVPHDLEYESWLEVTAAAQRWASFPTDNDVLLLGEALEVAYSSSHARAVRVARAALEAVKREDR
jgi:hypothetical protein